MMKRRLLAVMAVGLFLVGGCTPSGEGMSAPALASSSCSTSTKGISEANAKALAKFGRKHCSDPLEALHREYANVQFENGRSISVYGCLIEGDESKYRVVRGTQYCFVSIKGGDANIFAGVAVSDAAKKPSEITPKFLVVPEARNERFWIYSPKGGAFGGSDCLVLVRAVPDGDNFVEKVYLPVASGKWEAHDERLSVNTSTLKQYAKDFRKFLTPHNPDA